MDVEMTESGPRLHPRSTRMRPATVGLVTAIAFLAFAIAGAVAVESVHRSTEEQLLEQKVEEISLVLSSAITGVQVPLAAAVAVASATDGDATTFGAAMAVPVDRNQFIGALLIDPEGAVVAQVGGSLQLADHPERLASAVDKARAAGGLAIVDTLDLEPRVLGYAKASPVGGPYVIYAESALPARTGVPRPSGVFEDLDFSLFLGPERVAARLIYTSAPAIPLQGRVGQNSVPFGDELLTVAVSTDDNLAGTFFARLPWLIGIVGVVFALGLGLLSRSIVRGREQAEHLAVELATSYHEQRHVIATLQQSLLPRSMPEPRGAELASAFWPSDTSLEVGGDFYDAFQLDSSSWAVAIGDVCGKGVEAAALTAAVRHTLRAAAHQLTHPSDVLAWARDAVVAFDDSTFCTAAFAFLRSTPVGLRVDLALGGHPRPIWVTSEGATPVGELGTILGMVTPRFRASVHHLGVDDLLVFYTDGVTDAPGASAVSEEELCDLLSGAHGSDPDDVINLLRRELVRRRPTGSRDDIALLVVRSTSSSERGVGTSTTAAVEVPAPVP